MPRILVTDDDPMMVDFLLPALYNSGFEVEGYYSPAQALERFKQQPFDLVITDLYMPELDGRSLTLEVKAIKNDISVIIITAYPSSESILDLSTVGISDYITKPFDVDKLILSIKNILKIA